MGLIPAVPVPFRGRTARGGAQRTYAQWMAAQPVAGVAVMGAYRARHQPLGGRAATCSRPGGPPCPTKSSWRGRLSRDGARCQAGGADALLAFPRRDDTVRYHQALGRELPVIAFYLYEAGGRRLSGRHAARAARSAGSIGIKVATMDSVMTFQRVAESRAHIRRSCS